MTKPSYKISHENALTASVCYILPNTPRKHSYLLFSAVFINAKSPFGRLHIYTKQVRKYPISCHLSGKWKRKFR